MRKPKLKPYHSHQAVALVIVLASLVFLAALALAFLTSIGTELKSSKQYADGVGASLLSQSAFNLAGDQIVAATKGYSGTDPANPGQPLAWASQPGMIRTYDSSGGKSAYFKLYSWDVMQGTGEFDPAAGPHAISPTWFQTPALYTDLNRPIQIAGTQQYPIVDGNNLVSGIKDSSGGLTISGKAYDADGDTKWDIEGFNVSQAAPVESATSNSVPMPVKWLYVLQGGQVVAPGSGTGNDAVFSGADKPTKANPIVGRIAFWTDDETSKINVNTASEGVYWDTPRVKSQTEDTFKLNQPVNGEYQRYPGHPAATSLSTVIKSPPGWAPASSPPTVSLGTEVSFKLSAADWTRFQWANKIFGIIPRIGIGGSEGGTIRTAALGATAVPPILPDGDRLYASVEEFVFQPNRDPNDNLLAASPPVLTKASLERARFFLTASSRAPDLNLFNKPRVCIWPIHVNDTTTAPVYRTASDRLMAFCATMRTDLGARAYRYYFQREDPNSSITDLPTTPDVEGLGRNRMLMNYLHALTNQKIPGFGGDFASKYALDNDQILTEIFDYIRSTNLRDSLLVSSTDDFKSTSFTKGASGGTWMDFKPTPRPTNGQGQVVPIQNGDTRGFGRYRTVMGASLLFIGQADGDIPESNPAGDPVPAGHLRVQAMFIPQFFDPSVGASWNRSNFRWKVDLSTLTWGPSNVSMGFPAATTVNVQRGTPPDATAYGDQYGINQVVKPLSADIELLKSGNLQFSGGDVTFEILDPVGTTVQTIVLNFPPGPFPLPALAPDKVYSLSGGYSSPWPPTSTAYNFRTFSGRSSAAANTFNAGSWILDSRIEKDASGAEQKISESPDVIRSVGLKAGDPRLIAAQEEIAATESEEYFAPINAAKYNSTAAADRVLGMHNLIDGYGRPYYGCALGRLAPGLNYLGYSNGISTRGTSSLHLPSRGKWGDFDKSGADFTAAADTPLNGVEVGSETNIASGAPGDWDNAPFDVRDGPYINKADEGDSGGTREPYNWKQQDKTGGALNASLFTPNRQIPSAVTFGSLPTGVKARKPWQTLLFRPQPGHPGAGSPADHLLLDLFHMPVVEPYAISEPLSTAGRINMNFQMVPFTYIKRSTGIRALLKSEKVIAINDSQAGVYKVNDYTASPAQTNIRLNVDPDETLKGFEQRFTANEIFRSASEICDLHIVPAGATYSGMSTYWDDKRLTGDNSKERIYATLYPRLTTKSNTFTTHVRVQTLKKRTASAPEIWTEGKDVVTGEYRGSQTIERYLDPNGGGLPDYAGDPTATAISAFYKTRVIASKQFAP